VLRKSVVRFHLRLSPKISRSSPGSTLYCIQLPDKIQPFP
jgi:hypothetical protein